MKDCYAVHLIRWFEALPKNDDRRWQLKLWHRWRQFEYYTQEDFFNLNKGNLCRHIIDNRHAWSKEDLGYCN